ncbi:GNAT family N-acetyltransferase [Rothia nasisuis]|nr:GNAT family protein [Rothia nasisuis]
MPELSLPHPIEMLQGRYVTLEPLSLEGLREVAPKLCVPEVFAGGHAGGSAALPTSPEDYVAFFVDYYPWLKGGRSYLVRYKGELVGTTSFYKFRPEIESLAIGYTAYAPDVWGSVVNPDAKHTLLTWAFDHGFSRVEFEVAGGNERSAAAVRKLGATFDGELRRTKKMADGSWNSTLIFSILRDEWPHIRADLKTRIDS